MSYKELLNAMCVRLGFFISSKKTIVWIMCTIFFAMGMISQIFYERLTYGYFLANVAIHAIEKWKTWFENKKIKKKLEKES